MAINLRQRQQLHQRRWLTQSARYAPRCARAPAAELRTVATARALLALLEMSTRQQRLQSGAGKANPKSRRVLLQPVLLKRSLLQPVLLKRLKQGTS